MLRNIPIIVKKTQEKNISKFAKMLETADHIYAGYRDSSPALQNEIKRQVNEQLDSMMTSNPSLNNVKIKVAKFALNAAMKIAEQQGQRGDKLRHYKRYLGVK